jgi:hypothetical protein
VYKLVTIDLGNANIGMFEEYEKKVVPLLGKYGARVELGVRSANETNETHLLYFPDVTSFEQFLNDPARASLQDEWQLTGAVSTVTDVNKIDYLQ